jgi:hypothetical protein
MSTSRVFYLRFGFLFLVDANICRLGLALRFGALFELVLFSVNDDKTLIL